MAAPAVDAGGRTVVAARNAAVEEVEGQNERLRVAGPAARLLVHVAPPTVQLLMQRLRPPLLLPWQKRRLVPVADGIDAGVESVAAEAHLPLHRAGRAPAKRHRAGAVVLRAAARLRLGEVAKLPLMSPE